MMRRLMPGTVLIAIILCLLAFSHASPIPSMEKLMPQEDSPLLAVSTVRTNLFIRDDSTIACPKEALAQLLGTASLDDRTEPTKKKVSSTPLPLSAKRLKTINLPSLRPSPRQENIPAASVGFDSPALEPQPAQSSTQPVVADFETPQETGILSDLTEEQAKVVFQILDPSTAFERLPWNTKEAYRWSSQTKKNAILSYGHRLPSNPNDDNALNAKLEELWSLRLRGIPSEETVTERRMKKYRNLLLREDINGSRRLVSLAGVVQEGNEPWRTARNWKEAEREEDWGEHVWKWTETRLKEVLAYVLNYRDRMTRGHTLQDQIDNRTWKKVEAMDFEEFKKTIESVWGWFLENKKCRIESDEIYDKRRKLKEAGLARFDKYLLRERKNNKGVI
ncbi:hypothetical protein H0H93_012212 [Arthromyces matolae]|nr:hypothetical protein H0H93_012212 [Arthromyces matolae]